MKNILKSEICKIDREEELIDLNRETLQKREELKVKLNIVLKDEETLWKTRAKQH